MCYTTLSQTVRYTQKKNELAKPHINYESRTIVWYKTPNFEGKKQADLEKTHISVILYHKIDHFCPLKSNFHPFSAIWHNIWVWNCLLPSCYHLLVQVRHARSHFFLLGTNDWAKTKPKCKKYAIFFWKSRAILVQKSVFNHSYWCQKGKKRLLACLTCANKW